MIFFFFFFSVLLKVIICSRDHLDFLLNKSDLHYNMNFNEFRIKCIDLDY